MRQGEQLQDSQASEEDQVKTAHKPIIIADLPDVIVDALNYHIGFTGQGPTLLDVKPERELTQIEIEQYRDLIEEEKAFRRGAFRQACIQTIGEDPESDWSE